MTGLWSPTEAEPTLDRASQSSAMLGWMEEIAPYGIFTTDTALTISSWNRWMVAHSGKPAETVIGRGLVDVFPDLAPRRLDEHFHRALAGQIAVLSTALHKHLLPLPPVSREFGVPFMLQTARIAPLATKSGIVGTITILEDVTQRECQALILRRQQEHDRLLSSALGLLLESDRPLQVAADLFPRIAAPLRLEAYLNYLISPDGTELRLHAAGGFPAEVRKTLGTVKLGDGLCGHVAEVRRPLLVSAIACPPSPHTEMVRRLGLRSFIGLPLIIGDRLLGTLSFGSYERDTILTEEVEFLTRIAQYLSVALDRALREKALHDAQQALSEHAEVLETKIAERTVRLHETIQQLESFSYTIAHDLRAPIRALKGYTEILLNDHSADLPEDGVTIVNRLQRASHRLDALTRDLLRFSKIARQDVELGPVDVGEVVADVVQVTPQLVNAVEIRGPLGVARAQRTLLQQVLSNLFDNAIKFATNGAPLRIVVRSERLASSAEDNPAVSVNAFHPAFIPRALDPRDPRVPGADVIERSAQPRLRVWVEDNGIGIAPHSHQKVFGIFERVSGLENIEGTGIGLAIVARSMQQMGGSCGVESTLGEGARFWLDLDAA